MTRYLEKVNPDSRPKLVAVSLAFLWAPGQGEGNIRDWSYGPYKFGLLSGGPSGSREWARVNVQVNWIRADGRLVAA